MLKEGVLERREGGDNFYIICNICSVLIKPDYDYKNSLSLEWHAHR
jgi:hypothetical protein